MHVYITLCIYTLYNTGYTCEVSNSLSNYWHASYLAGILGDRSRAWLASQLKYIALDTENIWHGGCLTLAHLRRTDLITGCKVSEIIPVVEQGLEIWQGCTSVGGQVPDAAAYMCWATGRIPPMGVLIF